MPNSYIVKACVVSNVGKRRPNHEDNFLLDDGTYITEEQQQAMSGENADWKFSVTSSMGEKRMTNGIFAVSDGMGGHNAGEVASRLAMEYLMGMKEYILRTPDTEGTASRFQDYVTKANTVITLKASQNPELRGMGATLTGVLLNEDGVRSFNMGDSRTYCFSNGKLQRITTDHTEGQRLVDFGLIKEQDLNQVEGAKGITRYMGSDNRDLVPEADFGALTAVEDTTVILSCSDGLTDLVNDLDIQRILQENLEMEGIEVAAQKLLEAALEDKDGQSGGRDNTTILLVEIRNIKQDNTVKRSELKVDVPRSPFKRILAMLMILALAFSAWSVGGHPLQFEKKTGTVSKNPYYMGQLISLVIPSVIDGAAVKTIGANGFSNCKQLKNLTLPNNVTVISDRAFLDCSELTYIFIPKSVSQIGNKAFEGCTKLTIEYPASAKIKQDSFHGCFAVSAYK